MPGAAGMDESFQDGEIIGDDSGAGDVGVRGARRISVDQIAPRTPTSPAPESLAFEVRVASVSIKSPCTETEVLCSVVNPSTVKATRSSACGLEGVSSKEKSLT